MVDVSSAWVCHSEGHNLADVLLPVHISDGGSSEEELSQSEDKKTNWGSPVLLEQTEEGCSCVLTLKCSSCFPSAITCLLVVSEARTIEVYNQMGDYCGTVRGVREESTQPDSSDRGPFYRKQLMLENPSSTCEVKLLSLAGRKSVLVCRVIVGLQALQQSPARGLGIDMQQVQSLVDEMGKSLSPGAQNLMDMVQFQQKNQTGSLGGFFPLLMGSGGLSALVQGANIPPAAFNSHPQPMNSRPPVSSPRPADESLSSPSGTSDSSASSDTQSKVSAEPRGPISHAQLTQMMSHFLNAQGNDQALSPSPEFLPMLQSVCGQVTKLRLDDAALMAEKEKEMTNGSWELDSAMERRLEEMERRLKEHVDRRLDALEQKLEKALLSVLNQGAMSNPAGDALSPGPSEQTAATPAVH
ncbi:ATPase PAAT [Cheilinus undulatus]|uniref:ATPase PAAT n=1 Tax=Cheilinus undulatus TaxID=241271 RepID=UPI001BD4EA87|nr:ATPase PAAT [Cheilinus undulatus]